MKEAFGCATLRTGSLVIGWLGLMGAIFQLLHALAVVIERDTNKGFNDDTQNYIYTQRAQDHLVMVVWTLATFFYGSLVCGAYMKRSAMLIPFMVAQLLVLMGIVSTIIYCVVVLPVTLVGILIFLLALVLNSYCLCIVWNYYTELRSGSILPIPIVIIDKIST